MFSFLGKESILSATTSEDENYSKIHEVPNRAPILGRGYLKELINQNATNLVSDPRTIFAICHTEIDWGGLRRIFGTQIGMIKDIFAAQMHSLLSFYVSTEYHYSANGSWTIVAISILHSPLLSIIVENHSK